MDYPVGFGSGGSGVQIHPTHPSDSVGLSEEVPMEADAGFCKVVQVAPLAENPPQIVFALSHNAIEVGSLEALED